MTELDDKKCLEFTEGTLAEYYSSNRIIKMLDFKEDTDMNSNGNFVKIGLRPQLEREIFEAQTGAIYVSSHVIGLGRSIVLGEIQYFVNKLNEITNVTTENVKTDELEPKSLIKRLVGIQDSIIVSSEKVYDLIIKKEWRKFFLFIDGNKKFIGHSWYVISSKTLGHNIWIVDKSNLIWTYKLFDNPYTKKKEKLFIEINPGSIVDVLLYSSVRFYIHETDPIHKIQLD